MYSISHPNKNGCPSYDLGEDEDAVPVYSPEVTSKSQSQVLIDRVLTKAVSLTSHFKPIINNRLRSMTTSKLWRMGRVLWNKNSRQRKQLLENWKQMKWRVHLTSMEVRSVLVQEKENLQSRLDTELTKNSALLKKVEYADQTIKELQAEQKRPSKSSRTRKRASKSWADYSSRHKRFKGQQAKEAVNSVLGDADLNVIGIKVVDRKTEEQFYIGQENANMHKSEVTDEQVSMLLYAKERFGISNAAYHELTQIFSTLPRTPQLQQKVATLNKKWEISRTPNDTVGVQQSLKSLLEQKLEKLVSSSPRDAPFRVNQTVKVKLTGDGTNIGHSVHVVVFGFTIIEDGGSCGSAYGNNPVCLLKESENYDQLKAGLQDVFDDIKKITDDGISIQSTNYTIQFYLGGDWKFLACVCGLEAANSDYACIWCHCSKEERHLEREWSITDEKLGARTVSGIIQASKLPKKSPRRYNCSREPLFSSIPMHRVIIDHLHLFLRVCDNLINLLIRALQLQDGLEKTSVQKFDRSKATNMSKYQSFLQDECNISFQFYVCQDSKSIKWRDLKGPEKYRLFSKINLITLFPSVPRISDIQELWTGFMKLNRIIRSTTLSTDTIRVFKSDAREWLHQYLQIYQTKNITPYIHALVAHVPQFMELYGGIVAFTQQGLEKLNDDMTQFFYRGSNHRGQEALQQMLQKKNRLTYLCDSGFKRPKRKQVCSYCKKGGHNSRTCKQRVKL